MAASPAVKQWASVVRAAAASFLLIVLLSPTAVQTIRSTGMARSKMISSISSSGVPVFPGETHFLIVSSPQLHKIVYTVVANGASTTGRTAALIDQALHEPRGMAVDQKNGVLYVADAGYRQILSYNLVINAAGDELSVDERHVIVEDSDVDSVAVDDLGNLFYTSGSTNNINKIGHKTLAKVRDGEYDSKTLRLVNAKKLMGDAAAEHAKKAKKSSLLSSKGAVDIPDAEPIILSLYESSINPFVTKPAAISVQGTDLLWTNKISGRVSGTVVLGQVNPKLPDPPTLENGAVRPFPVQVLSYASDGAYGLAKTGNNVFWSTNTSDPDSGTIYGAIPGEEPLPLVEGLAAPRSLEWDGMGTVYFTDEETGIVRSFPTGRIMQDAPLTHTIELTGAYGVALVK